jgi:hypothetical protein
MKPQCDLARDEDRARMWGMAGSVARFGCAPAGTQELAEPAEGCGLFEYWAFGGHKPTGLTG